MSALVRIRDSTRPSAPAGLDRKEIFLAVAAFAVLCVAVLRYAPYLAEPDDFAYRASIVAMTQGHSLSAVLPNFRYMPAHLIEAMPMLVLGLAGLVWIVLRWVRLRRADGEPAVVARRDFAVGLSLAAAWFSVWGLYAAYTWTAEPGLSSLQAVRFYLPSIGAIALLGAWLLVRVPPRASLAALTSAAVVASMFGLGVWSYNDMRVSWLGGIVRITHGSTDYSE